jgi:hypothetical protein
LFLLTINRVNNGYFSIVFYSKVARKARAGCPDGAGVARNWAFHASTMKTGETSGKGANRGALVRCKCVEHNLLPYLDADIAD